jgi:hypothetical protein
MKPPGGKSVIILKDSKKLKVGIIHYFSSNTTGVTLSGKFFLKGLSLIFVFIMISGNGLFARGYLHDTALTIEDTIITTVPDTSVRATSDTTIMPKDTAGIVVPLRQDLKPGKDGTYAKITRVDGVEITVSVKNSNLFEVTYVYPMNTEEHVLSKADIKEITWPGGKKEEFGRKIRVDSTRTLVLNEKDWELVTVTDNMEEIQDLKEKGEIEATFESHKLKIETEFLEKNASIILRKKAARINAHKVLIKSKEIKAGYGELPSIEMKAIAYGYE